MPTLTDPRPRFSKLSVLWSTLLTGYGSQLALVGAYVLAGELKAAQGDHQAAFPAYERELRPFVEQEQKNISPLKRVVPGSAFGLWMRNQVMKLMNIPSVARSSRKEPTERWSSRRLR